MVVIGVVICIIIGLVGCVPPGVGIFMVCGAGTAAHGVYGDAHDGACDNGGDVDWDADSHVVRRHLHGQGRLCDSSFSDDGL